MLMKERPACKLAAFCKLFLLTVCASRMQRREEHSLHYMPISRSQPQVFMFSLDYEGHGAQVYHALSFLLVSPRNNSCFFCIFLSLSRARLRFRLHSYTSEEVTLKTDKLFRSVALALTLITVRIRTAIANALPRNPSGTPSTTPSRITPSEVQAKKRDATVPQCARIFASGLPRLPLSPLSTLGSLNKGWRMYPQDTKVPTSRISLP